MLFYVSIENENKSSFWIMQIIRQYNICTQPCPLQPYKKNFYKLSNSDSSGRKNILPRLI